MIHHTSTIKKIYPIWDKSLWISVQIITIPIIILLLFFFLYMKEILPIVAFSVLTILCLIVFGVHLASTIKELYNRYKFQNSIFNAVAVNGNCIVNTLHSSLSIDEFFLGMSVYRDLLHEYPALLVNLKDSFSKGKLGTLFIHLCGNEESPSIFHGFDTLILPDRLYIKCQASYEETKELILKTLQDYLVWGVI